MKKYLAILALTLAGAAVAQDPTADQLIAYFEGQRTRQEIRQAARHSDDPAALYFAITQQYQLEQRENLNRRQQLINEMFRNN
jgi:Skp family chaperone for outer membrane proteins